jgi:hypothetical protein
MPRKYDHQCVEDAKRLYMKYSGQNFGKIETEMRRKWPGWQKQNLIGRGADKPGWIEKYGWEAALKLKLQADQLTTLSAAQRLAQEIENMRMALYEKASADPTDKDFVAGHRNYAALSIQALERIDAARHTLDGFVEFYEAFCDWAGDLDETDGAIHAQWIVNQSPVIIARAKKIYGTAATEQA